MLATFFESEDELKWMRMSNQEAKQCEIVNNGARKGSVETYA